jgi:hypothetical protein
MDTRAIHVGEAAGGDVAGWSPIEIAASSDGGFGGPVRAYWQKGPGYVLTAVVVLRDR